MFPIIRTSIFQRSFRAMSPKIRSICNAQALLNKYTYPNLSHNNHTHDKAINLDLKFSILQHSYDHALKQTEASSKLCMLIEAIPEDLLLDEKLQWLSNTLLTNYAMPVITAHPTRVLSNEAIIDLTQIIDHLIQLKQKKIPFEHANAFKAQLAESIQTWVSNPIVPTQNLTPKDEAMFALFLYKRALATFPEFHQQIIHTFRKKHGGTETNIASKLTASIMTSYQNISSWVWADCDGNNKITKNTMASIIPLQQNAILELYTTKLHTILSKIDTEQHPSEIETLQAMHDYFQRCSRSICAGIWFDVAHSKKTQARILPSLEKLYTKFLQSSDTHEKTVGTELFELHNLINLAGFFGGLTQYMRQTTQLNQRVLNDLFTLLSKDHADIQAHMRSIPYSELAFHEKQSLLQLLRTEPRYFETLKKHQDQFQKETQQEIERLSFIREHTDLFPNYITSDTENKINFDEVLLLFRFSSFLAGTLRIGQIREHTLNTIPLCETPKDLKHFDKLFSAMFEDSSIRNKMIESGFVSYVAGPSDLGKKGGILVYISLLRAELQALDILKLYQQKYPELSHVKLNILRGYGGDEKRRNGASGNELHSTQQGLEAWRVLGATGAYPAFLHRVIGQPSESYLRAQELMLLAAKSPDAFHVLNRMEEQGTRVYQSFIESQSNKDLLIKLTSLSLEKRLNISSRAGAKINLEDPTNVRAIGVVNLYLITGIQWDVFMSVVGLLDLPEDATQHFPCLFNELTVIKDIVYKVLFTLAVSNFPRAWERIREEEDPALHATLAHIENSAACILEQSTLYFSPKQQINARAYIKHAIENRLPLHKQALGLMHIFGLDTLAKETHELLPHYARVTETVDAYKADPTPDVIENAILALRGFPAIAAGPDCIAELRCPGPHEALCKKESQCDETPRM